MKHVAVIDIGKTNAKVVVLDAATGAEIAAARMANVALKDGPDPHYDVEALWTFALDALRSFAKTPGPSSASRTASCCRTRSTTAAAAWATSGPA